MDTTLMILLQYSRSDMNENLQVITLQVKDFASDDIVLRLHNLNPLHPIRNVDLKNGILMHDMFALDSIRQKSLSLLFDIPLGGDIHKQRLNYPNDDVIQFRFTDKVARSSRDAQNTDEEGVFLSDDALRLAGRKPLQLAGGIHNSYTLDIPPNGIRSFVFTLQPTGSGALSIGSGRHRVADDEEEKTPVIVPTPNPVRTSHPNIDENYRSERSAFTDIDDSDYDEDIDFNIDEPLTEYDLRRMKKPQHSYTAFVLLASTTTILFCLFVLCCSKPKKKKKKKGTGRQRRSRALGEGDGEERNTTLLPFVLSGAPNPIKRS